MTGEREREQIMPSLMATPSAGARTPLGPIDSTNVRRILNKSLTEIFHSFSQGEFQNKKTFQIFPNT